MNAFFKSARHRMRLDVLGLGLDPRIKPVFTAYVRQRYKTGYWTLPPIPERESRFERLESEPTYGDRVSFAIDLFEGGRESMGRAKREILRENLFKVKPLGRKRYNLTPPLYSFEGVNWPYRAGERRAVEPPKWCYSRRFEPVEFDSSLLPKIVASEEGTFLVLP